MCGHTDLADIGIPQVVLDEIKPDTYHHVPSLWSDVLTVPRSNGHKYKRSHVVFVSGPALSKGAVRLRACGALRVGAGPVTVASPGDAALVSASHLTAIMIREAIGAAHSRRPASRKAVELSADRARCRRCGSTKGQLLDVLRSGAATTLNRVL